MGVFIELLEIVLMGLFFLWSVTSYIPDTETDKQKSKNREGQKEKTTSKCLLFPCVGNSIINIIIFTTLWAIEERIEKVIFYYI